AQTPAAVEPESGQSSSLEGCEITSHDSLELWISTLRLRRGHEDHEAHETHEERLMLVLIFFVFFVSFVFFVPGRRRSGSVTVLRDLNRRRRPSRETTSSPSRPRPDA